MLGLAFVVIKYGLGRSYQYRQQGKNLKVLDQIVLAPKVTLNLVKVGDKYLLLGVTETSITVLKELEDYPEVNELIEIQPQFADIFKRIIKGSGRTD